MVDEHEDETDEPAEPEDWLQERYPLVDADFVGETLERVLHDQSEIADEAARVDEIRFEPGVLDHYRVPRPSEGFVARTHTLVMAQRAAGLRTDSAEDAELRVLIEAAAPIEPSPDFVDRTLRSVMAIHPRSEDVDPPAPTRSYWRRRFTISASLAAIVLCSVVLFFDGAGARDDWPAPETTPVSWASLVTAANTAGYTAGYTTGWQGFAFEFQPADEITAFLNDAASAKNSGEDGR